MMEFVDCRTCKTDCVRADSVYGYSFCDKYTHPPMTNADRIRAMSDEELSYFLVTTSEFEKNITDAMKWLQQPTEKQKEDD